MWIFQRLPGRRAAPPWVYWLPRASGTPAFLTSLPVAFYCLLRVRFRRLHAAHPGALGRGGCLFFGAFTAKMLALRSRRLPGLTLPVLGAVTFTVFVLVWTLSALWWFRLVGLVI